MQMPLTSDWTTWALVFAALALFAYIVSVNMKTRKATPTAAGGMASPASDVDTSGYIARFLNDSEGKQLGESVSVTGGRLIVKESGTAYASIPLDAVKPASDGIGLQLTSTVDWDEARKLGEEWRVKSFKVITYTKEELPPEERTQ